MDHMGGGLPAAAWPWCGRAARQARSLARVPLSLDRIQVQFTMFHRNQERKPQIMQEIVGKSLPAIQETEPHHIAVREQQERLRSQGYSIHHHASQPVLSTALNLTPRRASHLAGPPGNCRFQSREAVMFRNPD